MPAITTGDGAPPYPPTDRGSRPEVGLSQAIVRLRKIADGGGRYTCFDSEAARQVLDVLTAGPDFAETPRQWLEKVARDDSRPEAAFAACFLLAEFAGGAKPDVGIPTSADSGPITRDQGERIIVELGKLAGLLSRCLSNIGGR